MAVERGDELGVAAALQLKEELFAGIEAGDTADEAADQLEDLWVAKGFDRERVREVLDEALSTI